MSCFPPLFCVVKCWKVPRCYQQMELFGIFLRTAFSPSSALFPSNSKMPVFFPRSTFCPQLFSSLMRTSLPVFLLNLSILDYTVPRVQRREGVWTKEVCAQIHVHLLLDFSWPSEISCLHFFRPMRLCTSVLLTHKV